MDDTTCTKLTNSNSLWQHSKHHLPSTNYPNEAIPFVAYAQSFQSWSIPQKNRKSSFCQTCLILFENKIKCIQIIQRPLRHQLPAESDLNQESHNALGSFSDSQPLSKENEGSKYKNARWLPFLSPAGSLIDDWQKIECMSIKKTCLKLFPGVNFV